MNLVSWNCRGLGNPQTVRELRRLVKIKHPHLLFLMETNVSIGRLQNLRIAMGFEGLLSVDPVGRSGGLALFWKGFHLVELLSYSRRHISVFIRNMGSGVPWKFTGFYGHPDPSQRAESWKLLKFLKRAPPSPWLCIGDFNEILYNSEKVGGNPRHAKQMESFREAVQKCNLGNLGFKGQKFTWSNKRENGVFVKERLDRGLASPDWCALFPNAGIEVDVSSCSDHHLLWLRMDQYTHRPQKIFRFEACWNVAKDCEDLIRRVWAEEVSGSNRMNSLEKKLLNCQQALVGWSSNRPGSEHLQLKLLYKRLGQLQKNENPANLEQIAQIRGEINKLLEVEDIIWKQRAKRNWYKLGDRNTQYFHAWANQRRRQNHIGSITDLEGNSWTLQQDIGEAFTRYYQNLFTSEGAAAIEDCISSVQARVPPVMNEMLTEVFTPEEVNQALAQMHPLKSPGPDGFGGCFFQNHWHVVGEEVRQTVLVYLNNEVFDSGY